MSSVPPIFVSSGAFGKRDFDEALALAREWELDRVELTGGMARRDDMDEKVKAVSDIKLMVHNYFPPPPKAFVLNLASEDEDILETSRAHCRRAVELSQAVGASHFSVHAGFAARVKPEHLGVKIPAEARTNKVEAARIFKESVAQLSALAAERGVRILIENNVVEPGNLVDGANPMLLLAEADEIIAFMEEMDDGNLGVLVDLGHANVSSNSLNFDRHLFCEKVAPYTEALHLSDNDGRRDSNKPFDKTSWIVDELKLFDPKYVVIEAYRLNHEEVRNCMEAVHEAYAG